MESAVGVQLAFCAESSFPSTRGTSRGSSFHTPLLPSRTNIPISSKSYLLADSALASSPSRTPIQTLTLAERRSSYSQSPQRMDGDVHSLKESKPPALRLYRAPSEPKAASRSSEPFTPRPIAVSSLHQRVFDHDPYPESPASPIIMGGSKYDLLPPFPSPKSPRHKRSTLLARLPRLHESQFFWLALYFFFNLGLTLYNKLVLVRFPFPYTLSAIHALFGTIGGNVLVRAGVFVPTRLNPGETTVVVGFSILYTVNIVISNVSLKLVTVPVRPYRLAFQLCFESDWFSQFHQVVRAATPLFTIIFAAVLLGTSSSRAKLISLIPVVAGVGFASVILASASCSILSKSIIS